MNILKAILCLTLMLGTCSCVLTEQSEANVTGQPLHLAHTCLRITLNGKKDERSPVLIIHGFGGFQGLYMDLVQHLAIKTARKVCTADLRNHGDSPWSNETDTKAMVSDLLLLMKTLDAEKIVLLGHSMGGKVAVDFAITYPEKIEKLIVEEMRPNGLSEEVQKKLREDKYMEHMRNALRLIPEGADEKKAKKRIANFYNFVLKTMDKNLSFDQKFVDYVPIKLSDGKWIWKFNIDVLEKGYEDPSKYMPNVSGKCEKPALFIYGEKSEFKVGDVKDEILELFPNAKLHAVKDGHHVVNGYPEYREEVVKFINAE